MLLRRIWRIPRNSKRKTLQRMSSQLHHIKTGEMKRTEEKRMQCQNKYKSEDEIELGTLVLNMNYFCHRVPLLIEGKRAQVSVSSGSHLSHCFPK